MTKRRSWLVYAGLALIWLVIICWQAGEHARARHFIHDGLRKRAEDISSTVAIIMRSQPRLFVSRERIETALDELVKQGEVSSVMLLNASNEEVAFAGAPIEVPKKEVPEGGYWDESAGTVTLMNVVNLGTNIIQPRSEFTNRASRVEPALTNVSAGFEASNAPVALNSVGNAAELTPVTPSATGTNGTTDSRQARNRPRFSEAEIKALIQNKGAHGLVVVMSSKRTAGIIRYDLFLRLIIGLLSTVAVVGCGFAWRNVEKNSELQIRLIRASELNSHLNQMNLAAAGLAHETRNPLNIVRGLAQMIFKQEDASPEIRLKSREIIEETDRVAAQLNEFINYSRPREVRRAATHVKALVSEVARALNHDIDEKKVRLQNETEDLTVEADEQLLRQALFNLVMNAIQAAPPSGEITVRSGRENGSEAFLEIADNGPGVAPENRAEIFKPYFTTHEEGTGLGLAVVQQIVLAHGWEITCLANTPVGACFRINHIKLAARN